MNEKMSCPSCGAPHEWPQTLPQTITCGKCKSVFSPIDELRRYSLHICQPGLRDRFIESHYSGRPFIIPRPGDTILSRYANLAARESLRVSGVEFEFQKVGEATRQVVYVLTEVAKRKAVGKFVFWSSR